MRRVFYDVPAGQRTRKKDVRENHVSTPINSQPSDMHNTDIPPPMACIRTNRYIVSTMAVHVVRSLEDPSTTFHCASQNSNASSPNVRTVFYHFVNGSSTDRFMNHTGGSTFAKKRCSLVCIFRCRAVRGRFHDRSVDHRAETQSYSIVIFQRARPPHTVTVDRSSKNDRPCKVCKANRKGKSRPFRAVKPRPFRYASTRCIVILSIHVSAVMIQQEGNDFCPPVTPLPLEHAFWRRVSTKGQRLQCVL
ncbi:hypothetical protein BC832DRAFT_560844 [Gaertneriomyces semiglobifer]|nr:hypothetical protein BC832DRAFT_560844 [Gaertneriomyces semiglobifer]